MITLGVGTGEEAAPTQVGRLFDMIALEGALRGALIGERSACLPQKP